MISCRLISSQRAVRAEALIPLLIAAARLTKLTSAAAAAGRWRRAWLVERAEGGRGGQGHGLVSPVQNSALLLLAGSLSSLADRTAAVSAASSSMPPTRRRRYAPQRRPPQPPEQPHRPCSGLAPALPRRRAEPPGHRAGGDGRGLHPDLQGAVPPGAGPQDELRRGGVERAEQAVLPQDAQGQARERSLLGAGWCGRADGFARCRQMAKVGDVSFVLAAAE